MAEGLYLSCDSTVKSLKNTNDTFLYIKLYLSMYLKLFSYKKRETWSISFQYLISYNSLSGVSSIPTIMQSWYALKYHTKLIDSRHRLTTPGSRHVSVLTKATRDESLLVDVSSGTFSLIYLPRKHWECDNLRRNFRRSCLEFQWWRISLKLHVREGTWVCTEAVARLLSLALYWPARRGVRVTVA